MKEADSVYSLQRDASYPRSEWWYTPKDTKVVQPPKLTNLAYSIALHHMSFEELEPVIRYSP